MVIHTAGQSQYCSSCQSKLEMSTGHETERSQGEPMDEDIVLKSQDVKTSAIELEENVAYNTA